MSTTIGTGARPRRRRAAELIIVTWSQYTTDAPLNWLGAAADGQPTCMEPYTPREPTGSYLLHICAPWRGKVQIFTRRGGGAHRLRMRLQRAVI